MRRKSNSGRLVMTGSEGSIAVVVAIAMVVLLGAASLAIDVGQTRYGAQRAAKYRGLRGDSCGQGPDRRGYSLIEMFTGTLPAPIIRPSP